MSRIPSVISPLAKFYFLTLAPCAFIFLVFSLIGIEFVNILFFTVAFIWHFALVAPGLKEKVITNRYKYSFLNVIVKFNYYLQMFIKVEKFHYTSSLVRAMSPLLFTGFLLIVGGSGNLVYGLFGSFVFEVIYLSTKKYYQSAISSFQDAKEIQKD